MALVTWSGARWHLAAGVLLSLVAIAHAQPIRIPDFRESPPASATPKRGEACNNCGVIRTIREMQVRREVTVPRAFQTEQRGTPGSTVYVGAVVVLPMGEGTDKPFVGGVGTPEMRERFSETTYEVVIRLDTGAFTSVQRRDGASYNVGDRVRVQGTQLEVLAP